MCELGAPPETFHTLQYGAATCAVDPFYAPNTMYYSVSVNNSIPSVSLRCWDAACLHCEFVKHNLTTKECVSHKTYGLAVFLDQSPCLGTFGQDPPADTVGHPPARRTRCQKKKKGEERRKGKREHTNTHTHTPPLFFLKYIHSKKNMVPWKPPHAG